MTARPLPDETLHELHREQQQAVADYEDLPSIRNLTIARAHAEAFRQAFVNRRTIQ